MTLAKKYDFETTQVKSHKDIVDMEKSILQQKPKFAAFDTETTGLDIINDKPFQVIFGFNKEVYSCTHEDKELFYSFIETMYNVCLKLDLYLFAHNAKYDWHMLMNTKKQPPEHLKIADSCTIARLAEGCDKTFTRISLEALGEKYVDKDSKKNGKIIKKEIQALRRDRKQAIKYTYEKVLGLEGFNKEWKKYQQHIPFITKYHEVFEDYEDPNYYDVYLKSPKMFIEYGIDDVVILLLLLGRLLPIYNKKYSNKEGVCDTRIFERENALIRVVGSMEREGLKLDIDYLVKSYYTMKDYSRKLYGKLEELTGKKFSVGQIKVLKGVMEDLIGNEIDSTNKKTMKKLARDDNKKVSTIAEIVSELRTLDKWTKTYIVGLLKQAQKHGDVYLIHPSINNSGTVSGRVSSNFQQMPKKPFVGGEIELFHPRKAIVPKQDKDLYFLDFSQIELRALAECTIRAGEPDKLLVKAYAPYGCINTSTLIEFDINNPTDVSEWCKLKKDAPNVNTFPDKIEGALKEGYSIWADKHTNQPWKPTDIHKETTARAFPELTIGSKEFKKARGLGKTTNYAKIYGAGVTTLADHLGTSIEDAEKLSKGFDVAFPGVKHFNDMVTKGLQIKGYIENLYGRKYYIENSSNFYKGGNYILQGTCADMLKEVEVRIYNYLKKTNSTSKMLLVIHDEIVVEGTSIEDIKEIKKIMESVSETIKYIPIVCGVEKTTTNWAEKKEVTL